jgi:hypothetical protein
MRSRWWPAWLLAALCAVAIVGASEWRWRSLGYVPNIRDSAQLWSIERDRAYVRDRKPLVLLGASRIQSAIDMKLVAQLLPRYEPVMLAQNAHYPLATLHDLANDDAFRGVVLCDLDSAGLYRMYADMQQPLVDYFHRQWSPSWHLHRILLNAWQAYATVANPDLGPVAALRRVLEGKEPPRPDYFRFYTDRSIDIDYQQVDVAAARRHFADALATGNGLQAAVTPERWLADLADVHEWTARINARGGEVIFYQSPVSGDLRTAEAIRHPPAQYWDKFAATATAATLDGNTEPRLSAFVEPDDSHLDFRDKPEYTRALVDVLVERGWVER